ncbi:hypothetical protein J437_LFUL004630 [Ladona fulva]|uniref:peptidyl-tRNA hydrolase n=1 Tax=Ladona fulva TaxID=123851 RepID=A0A8K0JYM1_LADFU|nr:hypothetical protein J437_LFUL004630 [Ladona fulva]
MIMGFYENTKENNGLSAAVLFGLGIGCGWIMKGNSSKIVRLLNFKGSGFSKGISKTKMVLVVRTDLGMGTGKVASQCAHAALSCLELVKETNVAHQWMAEGQPKIVLKLDKGEYGLLELRIRAHSVGVPSTVVRDAGRTQVMAGSATVLGLGPACAEKLDTITGHLKLL